jgi:hypothetical protein
MGASLHLSPTIMADEDDYIAGYDPFLISGELRKQGSVADLDAYYDDATSGRGANIRGKSLFGLGKISLG